MKALTTLKQKIKAKYYQSAAAITLGSMALSSESHAGGQGFSTISNNIVSSTSQLPGLVSTTSYMVGLLLAILGALKIKDHVENPGNTPLKDGVIRLVVGGAAVSIPAVLDAMEQTIGNGGGDVEDTLFATKGQTQ